MSGSTGYSATLKLINQRYEVVKTLNTNAFGSVFQVKDLETKHKLIAKLVIIIVDSLA